jgi:hypothetical protein
VSPTMTPLAHILGLKEGQHPRRFARQHVDLPSQSKRELKECHCDLAVIAIAVLHDLK